jgi:thioredoxin-dependent peroxiredoxin
MTAHPRLLALALVTLACASAACGKKDEPAPTTAPVVSAAASAPAAPAGQLKEGDPAPDVTMTMQDGKQLKLSSLKGQMAVVYFYPKDQTPGCTVEAENFRDKFEDLKKAGIAVIGVSTQDAASHKAFIEKEKLPFDLAVDEDKSIAKAFGVPPGYMGMHARQTFLIGKDGKIKKVWRDVTPKDHANEVLSAAQS